MALTVCFESIVYEDALTILSYASPYPVKLKISFEIEDILSIYFLSGYSSCKTSIESN
jgi:hypothetical protein